MNDRVDETDHVEFLCKFENFTDNYKSYKEQKIKEIIAAICAQLNSKGGKVVLQNHTEGENVHAEKDLLTSRMSSVCRILEQRMISIIGSLLSVKNIKFDQNDENICIFIVVRKVNFLVTTNYNLFLPTQTQVVPVSPLESLERFMDDIIKRNAVLEAIEVASHCRKFLKGKKCCLLESKALQLKCVKADLSGRTCRLADRMTGKGNKFSCYVSAFANYRGGCIYYGIRDNGVVEGESIPNEEDRKSEITKKVGKVINKMIWPEQVGQPKRGEHWEIFFEQVVDENFKPIPSTFVIVIYIAPCLGGVFIEEPECYEMVEGTVEKMSFVTWKERIMQPVRLQREDEIPRSIPPIPWSSDEARMAFANGHLELMPLINNGDWDAVAKHSQSCQRESQLSVLSKKVTACFRRGHLNKARTLLKQYMDILPQSKDRLFFEVIGLYLQAGLKRAEGSLIELKELLTGALSKAEMIEPGLITATILVFAATVTDEIDLGSSPNDLSFKALEHLRRVSDSSKLVANIRKKIFLILAAFYLGSNINGKRNKMNVDRSRLDEAKTNLLAVDKSVYDGNPLSVYHEVQFNLVQSILQYRNSQVNPDERIRLLRDALHHAKKAECLARDNQFTELIEWSKANKALCTEQLVRNALTFSATKRIQAEKNRNCMTVFIILENKVSTSL